MLKKTFILTNGKESNYDTRDDGNTVSILAITQEQKVVLVRVFRPGPEKFWMPCGYVDGDETPIDAAKEGATRRNGI